jgi:hydroxyacylglutathione hydrolase
MEHVVQRPNISFPVGDQGFEVHQVPAAQDNLIWLLVCVNTRETLIVDGPSSDEVLSYAKQNNLRLTTILNTHTHPDHIGINRDLEKDGQLGSFRVIGPQSVASQVPGLTEGVGHNDVINFAGLKGRVFLTEGHIDGHISVVFEDVLFCGDTLFTGGCGYLFDGPPRKMFESLMMLANLPGNTRVCCAHEYTQDNLRFAWSVEPDNEALAQRIRDTWTIRKDGGCAVPSTIDLEQATNPFLRPGSSSIQSSLRAALPHHGLDTFVDVFTATRALKDAKHYRAILDDVLPLDVC